MFSEINYSTIKHSHHMREIESKKVQEKKRQLIYLVQHYLKEEGFFETAKCFEQESKLSNQFQICDNIDLSMIVNDFETYYNLRFQKMPKIVKKIDFPIVSPNSKKTTIKPSKIMHQESESKMNTQKEPQTITHKTYSQNKMVNNSSTPELDLTIHAVSPASSQSINCETNNSKSLVMNSIHENNQQDRFLKPIASCMGLSNEYKEMASEISRSICLKDINVCWNDITGLDEAKKLIKEAIVYPSKYPELFSGWVSPWKGLLLYGPPGTGKTMLAKAIATECKTTFFNISASSLISKWRGDSEKLVRVLFEMARYHAPSTIFLDEIEALASHRDGSGDHQASRRLTAELLGQLDGLESCNDDIFLLAASNLPWELDTAMLRRLEKRILIDLPDLKTRKEMFERYLPSVVSNQPLLACHLDYDVLAEETTDYSGSDIRLVCKEAAMQAMRQVISVLDSNQVEGRVNMQTIATEDVRAALCKVRSSVGHIAHKYHEWRDKFGAA